MPIYQYHCRVCGVDFEVQQSFSDTTIPLCPNGHSDVVRVFSPPRIIFKGSGWYVTDNKPKNGHQKSHIVRSQERGHNGGGNGKEREKEVSPAPKEASSSS